MVSNYKRDLENQIPNKLFFQGTNSLVKAQYDNVSSKVVY